MIFVDTGAFLARHLANDQHHEAAAAGWRRLAAERARALLASTALTILRPEARDENEALRWLEKLGNQAVSFTDCVSFALMKRHRLPRAFGFDRHFIAAGFSLWPSL